MKQVFYKIGFVLFYVTTVLCLFLACTNFNEKSQIEPIQKDSIASEKNLSLHSNTMNTKERDARLIGTWRYTEVLSSGYGGDYTSLTTDYFFQFSADGIFASWTGNSALGNSGGNSIDDLSENVVKAQWYTKDGYLYFVDATSQEEAGVKYFIDNNRLMLSGNGENKVMEKLN
ncbi:MAG: hypothetical protein R2786_03805 [Flavobacteriaceae bacterium]